MKRLHCDKDDNNDDIMQMKTANKGGNREVAFYGKAIVVFGKELRWFEIQKERNSIITLKKLFDLAVAK